MLCENCEVNEASVTIIPTGEGLPQSVCSICMARMGLALAKELIPGEEIMETLGPIFVQPAREDIHDAAAKVRKSKKAKAEAEAPEAQGEAGGPPEVQAAASDE